jgi:hypothetical protein
MARRLCVPAAGVLVAAGLVVSGMAAPASGLVAARPAAGPKLPADCTSSGLEVLCVYGTPTAKPIAFVVPTGVSAIQALVQGGAGGDGPADTSIGGFGGTASSVLFVHPGDTLDLRVGGRGQDATMVGGRPAKGGVNGGGAAGSTGVGGGGGRSEIHARAGSASVNPLTTDPLIAAGGGGGGGAAEGRTANGGSGGGTIGLDGLANATGLAGHGGTATAGGAGAGDGSASGVRGAGGSASGAGGGGGYYGGGAGNATDTGPVRAASIPNSGVPSSSVPGSSDAAVPPEAVPSGTVPGLAPERTGGGGGGSGFGLPGTIFGIAPKSADGIIQLRFKRLLMDVDVARVCAPDGPVPPGWVLREGSDGDDVLVGSDANDLIRGRFGRDRIDGRGGDDILCGDAGADVLRGGDGNDVLIGGGGRDKLNGGLGADRGIDVDANTVRVRVESSK